ncbi:UNVERIFIED_CONTAM: hypothetical protein HDU68_006586 [Siphonaria sp. JEL0065]|nr:hypothetical protein HDU68_006586 [Siphonaria sp. JEL0065]
MANATPPPPPRLKLFVPAYWYPTTNRADDWTTTINNGSSHISYMVLNPNSGPGTQRDPLYVDRVKKAQSVGIKVLVYVATNYGARSLSAVTSEHLQYSDWYKVDGIFVDEVASNAGAVKYYQTLANFVRTQQHGNTIVINPGTYPDELYMKVCDYVMAFEDSFKLYSIKSLTRLVPSWTKNYSPERFIHLAYDVPSTSLADVMALAKKFGAGHVYFTNLALNPHPYEHLPKYFSIEAGLA